MWNCPYSADNFVKYSEDFEMQWPALCCVFGPDGKLKAKNRKESDFFVAGDEPTIVATGAHLICYPGGFNMSTGELLWELVQRASSDIIIGTKAIAIIVFTFRHGGKLCKLSLVKFSKVHQPSYRKGFFSKVRLQPLFSFVVQVLTRVAGECKVCNCRRSFGMRGLPVGLKGGEEVWQLEAICYFC
ncbi:hypothetical protein COLO4_09615 [Corchorus olitorius]|uniref:Uncharacterized protein n=1 Tax=Corchorus olitorius TaxID=93759 RepID=A0A1R3KBK9_9ROSI|nr:hypothetical protein COLO4_09615 [Corchorus olitorius]